MLLRKGPPELGIRQAAVSSNFVLANLLLLADDNVY